MNISNVMSGCLVVVMTLFWLPPNSEAAPGCDAQDEKQWEKLRNQLPTSDFINIKIIVYDLTKLKDKCDPKTRFSASVVRLLIQANFRQQELQDALARVQKYENKFPDQSPSYDPGGMPGRF